MSNEFAALEDKYGTTTSQAPAPDLTPAIQLVAELNLEDQGLFQYQAPKGDDTPLTNWRNSQPVVTLSVFLKALKPTGPYLTQTADGYPRISLPSDLPDDLMEESIHLFYQARTDLEYLITIGAISLPTWLFLMKDDFQPTQRTTTS